MAIGIKAEMEISRIMGMLGHDDLGLYDDILARYGLIFSRKKMKPDALIEHMMFDKKNKGGRINFVLLNGIGNPVYDRIVDDDVIRAALDII